MCKFKAHWIHHQLIGLGLQCIGQLFRSCVWGYVYMSFECREEPNQESFFELTVMLAEIPPRIFAKFESSKRKAQLHRLFRVLVLL